MFNSKLRRKLRESQLADPGVRGATAGGFVKSACFDFHAFGRFLDRFQAERAHEPDGLAVHETAHVLAADVRDVFAEARFVKFEQAVAVTIFFAWKLLTAKSPLEPVQVVVQAPAPPPAAEPAKPVAGKAEGANDGRPSTIPDDKLPPRGDGAEAKGEGKSEKSEKSEHHHGKGGASKEKKVASADDGKKGADSAPDTGETKPATGSIDDLLLGAVPQKKTAKASADDDPSNRKAAEGAGPLAKNAVVAGMNAVKPKINDCYNQFKVPGMAMVNVVILKSGKVGSATVTGKFAGTPTGSCVEKAVKGASFPPSDGLTTPYPFNLK